MSEIDFNELEAKLNEVLRRKLPLMLDGEFLRELFDGEMEAIEAQHDLDLSNGQRLVFTATLRLADPDEMEHGVT